MIIVKLMGGLGNQLFQYALGRHLAEIHQTSLKLDISSYDDLKQQEGHSAIRHYELKHFQTIQTFAKDEEIKQFTHKASTGLIQKIIDKIRPRFSLAEQGYEFNPNMLKAHNNTYLYGYWQSEKYFKAIEGIIRKEFQLLQEPSPSTEPFLQEIRQNKKSISLHIRRSDYVTDQATAERIGALNLDYYEQAIRFLNELLGSDLCFYIFSDEPEWVKANLKINQTHFFMDHHHDANAYKDLYLMSQCHHHIIANSTFSWWGAWLNPNADKKVIAPQNWFKKNARWINGKIADTKDIIPEQWIKL